MKGSMKGGIGEGGMGEGGWSWPLKEGVSKEPLELLEASMELIDSFSPASEL